MSGKESLEPWRRFFRSLGVVCGTVETDCGLALYPHLWARAEGDGPSGGYWFPHEEWTRHDDVVAAARRLSDQSREYVFLVGGTPRAPRLSTRTTRRKGRKRQAVRVEGSRVLVFPPRDRMSPDCPFIMEPRLHALQEDHFGNLDVWPLYFEDLPVRTESYTQTITALHVDGSPGVGVYVGCGRAPDTPRLLAAYAAMREDAAHEPH